MLARKHSEASQNLCNAKHEDVDIECTTHVLKLMHVVGLNVQTNTTLSLSTLLASKFFTSTLITQKL